MDRLTFQNNDGTWGIHGYDIKKVPKELYGALCKLRDYENICPSMDRLKQVSGLYLEKCEEVNRLERMKGGWIPVTEKLPETYKYILLSFENFPIPLVGRYEEDDAGFGNFYIGDDDHTCLSEDMYVNAWQPLPEQYRGWE